MPLIPSRQARPMPRDLGKVRDAKLFVVATEDRYAPAQYFSFLNHPKIHVEVLGTRHGEGADAARVIARLTEFIQKYQISDDDQLWALLDTDHWVTGNHKKHLIESIGDARLRGFHIAMSNPCFDFWLLLHHEDIGAGVVYKDCAEAGARIRELKGEFNKTNLKKEHYPTLTIQQAIDRAKALEPTPLGAVVDYWPTTNGSRVYLLMEELKSAGLYLSNS